MNSMIRTNATGSQYYYAGLLVALVLVFSVSPFVGDNSLVSKLLNISLLLTLLFSVLVISHSWRLVALCLFLALPSTFDSLQILSGINLLQLSWLSPLSGLLFVLLILVIMLRDMFSSSIVNMPLILGAIAVYFMMALLWGYAYILIDYIYPYSFRSDFIYDDHVGLLMYFSMVTMTTLGYGDIVPISPQARSLATLQAVAGQIYLAVLVARLVGMHIAQHKLSS